MQETKVVVTVAAMARMVGLSRARFYQLIGTAFPYPERSENGRPYYTEGQQSVCLDVRRRNCGVDGKPILFYARGSVVPTRKPRTKPQTADVHVGLLDAVRALGLTTVTLPQVTAVVKQKFPTGVGSVDEGEIIRAVFVAIQRQNQGDNVQR